MHDQSQKTPFYERRGFQGAVAVVGLLTAVWALVGAPRPWQVVTNISATTVPLSNTEIVLDASSQMAAPFGQGTKLEAAKEAIGRYVVPLSNEGIALRRAGGSCGEAGDLLVGFGDDHGDEVRETALAQQPSGKSNIANAVRAAVDDFKTDAFQDPDSANRILVFVSGEDECSENAGAEIREELEQSHIDTAFRFVALNPSGGEMKRLRSFTDELGPYVDAEIHKASSEKQLKDVVRAEARAAAAAAAPAARSEASQAAPAEDQPVDGPRQEEGGAPASSPRKESRPGKERSEKAGAEKDPAERKSSEKECPEKESAGKESTEKEPAGTEPVETEPVETESAEAACAKTEPLDKAPTQSGSAEAAPPPKEETSPGTTTLPESGASSTPAPDLKSSTSSNGVALRWPFRLAWRLADPLFWGGLGRYGLRL